MLAAFDVWYAQARKFYAKNTSIADSGTFIGVNDIALIHGKAQEHSNPKLELAEAMLSFVIIFLTNYQRKTTQLLKDRESVIRHARDDHIIHNRLGAWIHFLDLLKAGGFRW